MSDQTIHLTLSRADAARLRGGVCACHSVYEDETITRLLGLIDAALNAALAEGPERAATGETLDQAIATCERKGWRITLASGRNGTYDAEVLNQTGRVSLGNGRSWRPLAALQDAMTEAVKYDVPAAIVGGGEGE